jgi:hypothetical protein
VVVEPPTDEEGAMRRGVVTIVGLGLLVSGGVALSPGSEAASPAAAGAVAPAVAQPSADRSVAPTDARGGVACPVTDPGADSSEVGAATHLFTRTTGDGVTIRVYRLPGSPCPPYGGGMGTNTTVVGCPFDELAIEMSDESAVGEGVLGGPVAVSPTASTSSPSSFQLQAEGSGAFGVTEGDPVWWVALRLSGEATKAQMTFGDGSTDEMTPVDGIVVLAHHLASSREASDPYEVRGSLELLDVSGDVIGTVDFPSHPPVVDPGPVPVPVPPQSANGSSGGGLSGSPGSSSSGPGSVEPVDPGPVSPPPRPPIACPLLPVASPAAS